MYREDRASGEYLSEMLIDLIIQVSDVKDIAEMITKSHDVLEK